MLEAVLMMAQAASVSGALADYAERTRAEVRCASTGEAGEVRVCGRREADHHRVPLIQPADIDHVPARTARLLDPATFVCGVTGAAFIKCGKAGVSTRIGFDGSIAVQERPLAP